MLFLLIAVGLGLIAPPIVLAKQHKQELHHRAKHKHKWHKSRPSRLFFIPDDAFRELEMRYSLKWPVYAREWDSMFIDPEREAEFERTAQHILANKEIYQEIEGLTGVPWWMIGLIHLRESDLDLSASLAQGDPWNERSTHIPISGPFRSFKDSAVWALAHDHLSSVTDWRLEKVLWYLEIYNGLGYEFYGLPSPYLWGGTNIQRHGKFVHDGPSGWRPQVWDTQPGVAPVLKILARLDPTIAYVRETPLIMEAAE